MTEVDYGGGGNRTRLRDQEINCCVFGVPPAPVYKGVEEGEGQPSLWRALGESYSPFLVELGALPSSRSRREGKGREKEKERRGRPPP